MRGLNQRHTLQWLTAGWGRCRDWGKGGDGIRGQVVVSGEYERAGVGPVVGEGVRQQGMIEDDKV